MPFETFHIPESPDALIASVDRRLAAQDDARQQLVNALAVDVGASLQAQDKAQTTLSRALTRGVNKRIKGVSDARQAATSFLVNGVNASLSSQVAARAAVAGALLPSPRVAAPPLRPTRPKQFPPPSITRVDSGTGTIRPGSTDGIYLVCLHHATGAEGGDVWAPIQVYNGNVLGDIGNYTGWQGPFGADYGEVVNNPAYMALLGTPCGTGVTTGTGNGSCPVCPPPPLGDWYCITYPDGTTGTEEIPNLLSSPGQTTLDDGSEAKGPFTTEAEALLACQPAQQVGASCAAQSCEAIAAELTDITPVEAGPKCKLIDFGDWTFPLIGSEEFCQALPQILQSMTDAGQAFLDWIRKVKNDLTAWLKWLQTAELGKITGFKVLDIVIQLLAKTAGNFQAILWDILTQAIECYMDLAGRFPGCNPTSVVALTAIKTLLGSLHNQRIGSDAGLWWTLDISTRIPQWEQLLDYLIDYLCPYKIPSVGEAITAWTQGQITADQRDCWLKMHGTSPDVWQPVIISQGQTLPANDLIYYGRRFGADAESIDRELAKHGWTRDDDRKWLQLLYDKQPTTSDAFVWVRGNLYNDELAGKYGLDEGFSDFWQSGVGDWLRNQGMTEQTANYHYRATWTLPNLGAAREYLYRLRPDAVGDGVAFTLDNYSDCVDFANLSPLESNWRMSVVYRPLTTGDVDQLMLYDLAGPDRMRAALLDSGLNEADAATMTRLRSTTSNRQRAQMADGFTIRRVATLVRVGTITIDQGNQLLSGQGYSGEELAQAVAANVADYSRRLTERGAMRARMRLVQGALAGYQTGTVPKGDALSLLQSTGWDASSAQTAILAVDIAQETALVKTALSMLRGEYMRGVLNRTQTIIYLQGLGITPEAVDGYIKKWDIEHTSQRKLLTAGQLIRMVQEGLITAGEAAARLQNLGWHDPERQLLLAEVAQKMAAARAKEELAHEKAIAKQQRQEVAQQARADRAAARQAKQIQAAQKAALAELAKEQKRVEQLIKQSYPKGELKAWYKAGLITAAFVQQALRDEQYTDDAIQLMLDEWDKVTPNAPLSTPTTPQTR